ncbi:MAG: sugar ABC transporter substrate-binding protein [Firmicutes bacterium]|nr:sugar ABC transporter substrate-binding protein [Bacillota bacterium]
MRNHDRLLSALLGSLIVLVLMSFTASAEQVTLKYMIWDPSIKDTEINEVIKPFEAANPNIKIEFEAIPWEAYWQKVQTLSAAGTPPDVFNMSVAYAWDFANKGLIKNLQPMLDMEFEMDDYFGDVVDILRYNGDAYCFPFAWVCSVLYYNKDMFDAAGLDYPDETWNWNDLLDAAKVLTVDTNKDGRPDQWGFLSDYNHEVLDSLIKSNGGQVLSSDFSTCELNSPEAIEATQFLVDMINKHEVSPSPALLLQGAPDPFLTGRVAMRVAGSYFIDTYRTIKAFDWDITMVPQNSKTGIRSIYGGPDSVVIGSKTKYPKEAWEFVKFIIGKNRTVESFMGGKVPIYKPLAYSDGWLEIGKKPENKRAILDSAQHVQGADFSSQWAEWRMTVMNNELQPAFLGEKPVDACIKSATEAINKVLATH